MFGRASFEPRRAARRGAAQVAPGQLARHYSPRTPVILHARIADRPATGRGRDEAWVFLRQPKRARGENIFWLDPKGDVSRAARRLFAVLRRLDLADFRKIHVELARGPGLAEAINDRLRRAAAR